MATRDRPLQSLLLSLVLCLVGVDGMAYEEPTFSVVAEFERFEVRRYEPYIVAETIVAGDLRSSGNRAFRRLFGYISGDNRGDEKIKMTIPVSSYQPREPIDMGGPMVSAPADNDAAAGVTERYAYYFVMPSKWTLDTLPEPADDSIRLRRVPAATMAVREFSGNSSEKNYTTHRSILFDALEEAGIEPVGPAQFARYNGPFTLWFLRRNEAMVEVDPATLPER